MIIKDPALVPIVLEPAIPTPTELLQLVSEGWPYVGGIVLVIVAAAGTWTLVLEHRVSRDEGPTSVPRQPGRRGVSM